MTGLRSLGRGVAYTLESTELAEMRRHLALQWNDWLKPQDRQNYRPHVTVQNKVDPAAARALLDELGDGFTPFQVEAVGLELWWYRGGPWEKVRAFPFHISMKPISSWPGIVPAIPLMKSNRAFRSAITGTRPVMT